MKQSVSIHLIGVQRDGELAETTRQHHRGTLYDRNGSRYLLYQDAEVSTTIKLDPAEIRIYRRGAINSWQVFQLGELTGGLMTLGVNDMVLRVLTSHFELVQGGADGHLRLHYELWTGETSDPNADLLALSLGRFELSLDWQGLAPDAPPSPASG